MICEDKKTVAFCLTRCAHRDTCEGCVYENYERDRVSHSKTWMPMCVDVMMQEAAYLLDPPHRPQMETVARLDGRERIKEWEIAHGKKE